MKVKCFVTNLYNTRFDQCYKNLLVRKPTPDTTKYACLNGKEFSHSIIFRSNNTCGKEVMKGVCGKEAVENFDKNVAGWNKVSGIGLPPFSIMLVPIMSRLLT